MKLFGSLAELVQIKWRKNGQEITSRPNQSTTYTGARDIQLPPGDSNHVLVSEAATQALSNKTIDADLNSLSNIDNADIKSGAAIDATKIANGNVSNTEYQYLDGVTSDIQGQLNGKEPTITTLPIAKGGTNSGTALSNNRVIQSSGSAIVEAAAITASRALASDANGIPTHTSVTTTELGYVSGVTSALQTQINAKANSASPTLVTPLIDDYSDFNEEAAPGTPGSGKVRVYAKSDGFMYSKDDAGSETQLGGGSGTSPVNPFDRGNCSITGNVNGSDLSLFLKTQSGADPSGGSPVSIAFRSATTNNGTYDTVLSTSATSLVVPGGATLGWTSGDTRNVFIYAINNAGTIELGVSSTMLDESTVQTSTTIDTASDSLTGFYSTTGRTNCAIRYLGRILSTQATAGTWATGFLLVDGTHRPINGTAMSNSEATRLGLKAYAHGTSYNNSIAPTITTVSSIDFSAFLPYQIQDGSWRMKFNIVANVTSNTRSDYTLTINGVTFYNGAGQVASGFAGGLAAGIRSVCNSNASTITSSHASATTDGYRISGDVALASKPTWAY